MAGKRDPGGQWWRAKFPDLRQREVDFLALAAEGKTNQEIADVMGLSVNTMHNLADGAMFSLGARNRLHAVVIAIKEDIIDP